MVFSKLKTSIIQKNIKKIVEQHKAQQPSSKSIQSAGILTFEEISEKWNLQEMAREYFDVRNSQIYSYRKYDKHLEKSFKHFSENDFNVKGKIVDPSLQSFIDSPLDLLICVFDKKHLYLEYAAVLSKADFKLGFSSVSSDIYNMEVQESIDNVEGFFKESSKYLSIMKKIDKKEI